MARKTKPERTPGDRGRKLNVLATVQVFGKKDRACEASTGTGMRRCCRWLDFGYCALSDPDNERDLDAETDEHGDETRLRHPTCVKATKAVAP